MHKDEIKGKMKEAEGRIQDAVGDLTGNPYHDDEGKRKRAEGKLKQAVGKAKKTLHRAID